MSGLEVLGGITAVITLLDSSIKIYKDTMSDVRISATFGVVQRRMPLIRDILETCQKKLEPNISFMTPDVCEALKSILEACEQKAWDLEIIFEKVIPGEADTWEKRYLKFLRRHGKGHKVEELMEALTQDVQLIVNHNVVKSATTEQIFELENIRSEMKSIESSTSEEVLPNFAFQSNGGAQTNNINSGSGQQINNNGHVEAQHFLSVTVRTGDDEYEETWTSDSSGESEVASNNSTQCFYCNQYGHIQYFCPRRKCFQCGIPGHWKEDCNVPPRKWRK